MRTDIPNQPDISVKLHQTENGLAYHKRVILLHARKNVGLYTCQQKRSVTSSATTSGLMQSRYEIELTKM